jgi:hypothetical protein
MFHITKKQNDELERFEPTRKQPGFLLQVIDADNRQESISRDEKTLFFEKDENGNWHLPKQNK